MFFRLKKSGERAYVQIVENKRIDGAVRQSVIATLGRADELNASGALASLLASGANPPNLMSAKLADVIGIQIVGLHQGQRKYAPRQQAGHMTAVDQIV
jgi:hypothetical protein